MKKCLEVLILKYSETCRSRAEIDLEVEIQVVRLQIIEIVENTTCSSRIKVSLEPFKKKISVFSERLNKNLV